jgi:hypothetical protein
MVGALEGECCGVGGRDDGLMLRALGGGYGDDGLDA